jgi:DNA-binding MarR family transcriptional regulator
VLRILQGAGALGLSGRHGGERLVSRVPDVPRLPDRMEEMGLIQRERDPGDRRHVSARITPRGLEVVEEVTPVPEPIERERFASRGEGTLRSLMRALDSARRGRWIFRSIHVATPSD